MPWLTWLAYYFILWWLVLFATLPFSLRTQEDENDVTLGTVASAPKGPHVRRAMLRTTIVSAVIFLVALGVIRYFDLSLRDLPQIVPERPNG